jgi:hypothetical protein
MTVYIAKIGNSIPSVGGAGLLMRGADPGINWFSGEYNSDEYGTPDFYISTTGTGTAAGGGTLGDPWPISMLNNATAQARYDGLVVGVMDGTYNLINILGQHDGDFATGELTVAGGTVGNPTVLVSQTRNGAIIDYQRSSMTNQVESAAIQPLGAYVTIDGLHIKSTNYRSITNYWLGGDNLTVRNCLFTDQVFTENVGGGGKNSATFFSVGYSDILIQNNRFEGGGATADSDRHSVIQFYDSEDVVIEYNTIIGDTTPSGVCVYFKESLGTRNAEVRYNYLEKPSAANDSNMMILDQGDGGDTSSVHSYHHNIIYRTGAASGISRPWFWTETGTGITGTLTFYNNAFYGPVDEAGGLIRMFRGPPTQINFYNNILARPAAGGTYGDIGVGLVAALGTWNYNLYDSSPDMSFHYNSESNTATGLAAWQTASSKDANSSTTADPLFNFTGTEAEQFILQSGSTAKTLGAGSTEIGPWVGQTQIGCDF